MEWVIATILGLLGAVGALFGHMRLRQHKRELEAAEAQRRYRAQRFRQQEAEREELRRLQAEREALARAAFDAENERIKALPEEEQEAAMRAFVEKHKP